MKVEIPPTGLKSLDRYLFGPLGNMNYKFYDGAKAKAIFSPYYNYTFDKTNGHFARWGQTLEQDPLFAPFGPELLDISLTSRCNKHCTYCYQNSGLEGKDMSLPLFRHLLSIIPQTVTQIAFGGGTCELHPDFSLILRETRAKGIIPNYTTNGIAITEELAKTTAENCGAVAISYHGDWFDVLRAAERFERKGLKPNVHFILSKNTVGEALKTLQKEWPFKAIVFLLHKPQGRSDPNNNLKDLGALKEFLAEVPKSKTGIGFDSCSAPLLFKYMPDLAPEVLQLIEPCESSLFSYYIDIDGKGLPCSFCKGRATPISVAETTNFVQDVWYSQETIDFRMRVTQSSWSCDCQWAKLCRNCVVYPDITLCKSKA